MVSQMCKVAAMGCLIESGGRSTACTLCTAQVLQHTVHHTGVAGSFDVSQAGKVALHNNLSTYSSCTVCTLHSQRAKVSHCSVHASSQSSLRPVLSLRVSPSSLTIALKKDAQRRCVDRLG